jgi:hypothetical protein
LPPDAVCVTSARGDFDGTSAEETLTTYSLRGEQGPIRRWFVRADLPSNQVVVVDLRNLYSDLLDVTTLGAADARGDGHAVAFVVLRHGASTDFVGIVEVSGGHIVLAAVSGGPDRGRKVFAIGGTVTHGDGLTCTRSGNGALLLASGFHTDDGGKSYPWTQTSYRWSGLDLVVGGSASGSATSRSDPQLTDIGGGLRCGPLAAI